MHYLLLPLLKMVELSPRKLRCVCVETHFKAPNICPFSFIFSSYLCVISTKFCQQELSVTFTYLFYNSCSLIKSIQRFNFCLTSLSHLLLAVVIYIQVDLDCQETSKMYINVSQRFLYSCSSRSVVYNMIEGELLFT